MCHSFLSECGKEMSMPTLCETSKPLKMLLKVPSVQTFLKFVNRSLPGLLDLEFGLFWLGRPLCFNGLQCTVIEGLRNNYSLKISFMTQFKDKIWNRLIDLEPFPMQLLFGNFFYCPIAKYLYLSILRM